MASDLPGGLLAFLKTRPDAPLPDLQLLFNAAPMTAHPYFSPFRQPYPDGFACRAVLLRPESRGEVSLACADPRAALTIRQNFLATDNDWAVLRDGIRLVQDVGRQRRGAVRRQGAGARAERVRRRDRRPHSRDRDHRSSSAGHLPDGPGIRENVASSIRSFVCWGPKGCASSTPR